MEQKQTYVGIDVSKGAGGCRRPAYRPEMGRFLRRDRVRRAGLPDGGSGSLPSGCWRLRVVWNCPWWQPWQLRRCR